MSFFPLEYLKKQTLQGCWLASKVRKLKINNSNEMVEKLDFF
jgi:hypothetical protein